MPVNIESPDPFGVLAGYSPADTARIPSEREEEQLVGEMTRRYEESRDARSARERLWETNRLLLRGETSLAFLRTSSEVLRVVTEGDPRLPRSVDNLMRVNHRAFVGKLTRMIPAVRVRPRTRDRDDMLAAEIEDSWLDYCWHSMQLDLKYKRWVECIDWAGTGALYLCWDTLGGKDLGACPQCSLVFDDAQIGGPCPSCSMALMQGAGLNETPMQQDGQLKVPMLEKAKGGALRTLNLSPKDFYPDPGAGELAECQWIDVSRVLPVTIVRKMFPERVDIIDAEGDLYRDRYIYSSSSSLAYARVETRKFDDHVRLHEFLEVPTGEYPDGRILFMANGRILEIRDNIPHKLLGRFPVYLARGDRTDGELWGEDIISQAEPQHRERDILLTQFRRHRELGLNPRAVTTHNSGISKDALTATPGEVLKLKTMGAYLKFIDPPQMPPWITNEPLRMKEAVREKWAVTPHELGQTSAGESGRYAAFLETQSSETVKPLTIEIFAEWREFNRALIILGRHFMPPDEVWTITGRDKVMTFSWSRARVKDSADVYLAEEDALSKNPMLRLQNTMQLHQAGYYMDPSTGQPNWKDFRRDAGLRLDVTTGDADASEHVYAAQIPEIIERALMANDPTQMPQPKPWDDARIMADELLTWLRTAGRSKPEPVQRAVAQMWFIYAMAMAPPGQPIPPDVARLMPNQGLMGAPQQPAGPGAGGQPSAEPAGPPTADQETASTIQNADQRAQQAVSGGRPQEGAVV